MALTPSTATDNVYLRLIAEHLDAMGGGIAIPITETNPDYAYYAAANLFVVAQVAGKTVSVEVPHLGEADNMLLHKLASASHALIT